MSGSLSSFLANDNLIPLDEFVAKLKTSPCNRVHPKVNSQS